MGRARALVETIQIDVIELHASGVRIYQCERRTRDVFFCDADCGADSFHENGLARAEWTTEQQYLAAFEPRADLMPIVERLLRR